MSVRHFEDVYVPFKNFSGKTVEHFTPGTRYFGIAIPDMDLVNEMEKEGWSVRYNRTTGTYFVLVKISPEYDQDLSALDDMKNLRAEVFIEGIAWPQGMGEGMTALLISITPKQ